MNPIGVTGFLTGKRLIRNCRHIYWGELWQAPSVRPPDHASCHAEWRNSRYHGVMSDKQNAEAYLRKAHDSLAGAESECANRRFSNCANRAYYAAFQAAISALVRAGVRPRSSEQWPHGYVQAEFVGKLINRNRRYPSTLRSILSELSDVRSDADYRPDDVSEVEAKRGLRKSRDFLRAIDSGGETAP
jgi:uncharacterized protein (UPF0332 family)